MHTEWTTRAHLGPSPRSGIVRQHNKIDSETSIWADLTVSKHENHENLSCDEIFPAADLCTHDNNKHGDHTGSFLYI